MDSTRSPFRTSAADEPGLALRKQQRLDGASTVHGAVAFSHLIESERQVEHLPRIDFAAPHQVDQLGQVLPHWGGAAVEVHVLEEQVLAVQFDSVRDSYNLSRWLLRRFNTMRIIKDELPSTIRLLSDDIRVGPRPNLGLTVRCLRPRCPLSDDKG